ncbi:MAG: amino acid transporter, partial [Bacteroidetes bacterium QS_1_63_11]
PAIPLLAIALNLVLACVLLRDDPYTLVLGLGWIAIGGIVYAALEWRRSSTEPVET